MKEATENETALLEAVLKLHENFSGMAETVITAAKVVESLIERVVDLESKVNTQQ